LLVHVLKPILPQIFAFQPTLYSNCEKEGRGFVGFSAGADELDPLKNIYSNSSLSRRAAWNRRIILFLTFDKKLPT
jgi:hypothetical protein